MVRKTAHPGLGNVGDSLEEIWMETGGSCHLRCEYCFSESGGIDNSPDNLGLERILGILDEFQEMGGRRIGIVGAGEPFHRRNAADTFAILDHLKSTTINTTIFTTGDLLGEAIIQRLDCYPDIRLLIKFNSQDPTVQDRLVGSIGYTVRRCKAMSRLLEREYNDGKRLGIVTSIMQDNIEEMPDLLRYARMNHLIFDADTLLPRGRGETCGCKPLDEAVREMILRLQEIDREEFGNDWPMTGSYIASPPCTRFSNHLYISKTGKVHPCVGSVGVDLGDLKKQPLREVWDADMTKIIQGHNYSGKCTTCKNYQESKCHSCLGRACRDVTTEFLREYGTVQTSGCLNYRKSDFKS